MSDPLEDSSFEVASLLASLPVSASSHRKRIKAIDRFREYLAIPDSGTATEGWLGRCFYDDDVKLLMVGGDTGEGGGGRPSCGVLAAAGEPSSGGARGGEGDR